jgi:hypothetical protein
LERHIASHDVEHRKRRILKAVTEALEAHGAVFTPGGVAQRMEWRDPAPDAATRRRIVSGLNDARAAQNRAPLIDGGSHERPRHRLLRTIQYRRAVPRREKFG